MVTSSPRDRVWRFRPVVIEVPHFASLRGKEREIVVLRSDNGETWREHTLEATEDAVTEALSGSFEGEGDYPLFFVRRRDVRVFLVV